MSLCDFNLEAATRLKTVLVGAIHHLCKAENTSNRVIELNHIVSIITELEIMELHSLNQPESLQWDLHTVGSNTRPGFGLDHDALHGNNWTATEGRIILA